MTLRFNLPIFALNIGPGSSAKEQKPSKTGNFARVRPSTTSTQIGELSKGVECFGLFLFNEAGMALQQPGATVPAKNSIVVARGTNRFGFREAAHRLREKWGESVRRASHAHLRFRSPFMKQPGVVEAFVALGEPLEKVFYFSQNDPMRLHRTGR